MVHGAALSVPCRQAAALTKQQCYGCPSRKSAMYVQAGVTDNTPIYMLGGNILPFSHGGMTTSAAKTSNLTLVVAFASVWAVGAIERCSSKCSVPQVWSSLILQMDKQALIGFKG